MNCFGLQYKTLPKCKDCFVKNSCNREYIAKVISNRRFNEQKDLAVKRGKEIRVLKKEIKNLKETIAILEVNQKHFSYR